MQIYSSGADDMCHYVTMWMDVQFLWKSWEYDCNIHVQYIHRCMLTIACTPDDAWIIKHPQPLLYSAFGESASASSFLEIFIHLWKFKKTKCLDNNQHHSITINKCQIRATVYYVHFRVNPHVAEIFHCGSCCKSTAKSTCYMYILLWIRSGFNP